MALRVHNTMTGNMDDFTPLNGNKVGMYVCGINTYDNSHMGHAKGAVTFDVIRRHLEKKGYDLTYVVNFTDIEDHCIERALELDIPLKELADRYIAEYHKDMGKLGVRKADIYPIASEHMQEMIDAIQLLVEKDFAYEVGGSVYFNVSKVEDYGKLSHQKLEDMQVGSRIEHDEAKRQPMDFVLWKAKKPGEPFWQSPWGEGRPGWHIECSVMSTKYLGDTFDIHGGGTELIFPHHENEIMQSEALTGKPFVRYWLHGGLMNVGEDKMSKSLNNFFTIKDVLDQFDPLVTRFFLLNTHYRKPIDFNQDVMEAASQALGRLQNTLDNALVALETAKEVQDDDFANMAREAIAKFDAAMDEDFNTRDAIAGIFEFTREVNRYLEGQVSKDGLEAIISAFREWDDSLTIFRFERASADDTLMNTLIDMIIDIRQKARAEKNFALADEIRDRLKEMGIVLEDAGDVIKWKIE